MKIMKIIINEKEWKRMKKIIKKLNFFWQFQVNTKSKFYKLEEAIFTGKSENKNENVNDNVDFAISLLKNRSTSLESEFSKKDGII